MEDLNELLKQTVTAAEDGGEASKMWIRRGKKSLHERERAQSSTSDNEEIGRKNKQRRQEDHTTAVSTATSSKHHTFDVVEMRHKIEESRQKDVKQLNAQNAMVSAVSAQYSARMAHNIIQYVFDHELGGKHNNNNLNAIGSKRYNANEYSCVDFALAGRSVDSTVVFREHQGAAAVEHGFAIIRADIAVERATHSHVSYYKLQHIVSNSLSNNAAVVAAAATHSGKSGVNRYDSSVHWSKLSEDVIEYRRSLQPCSIAFDLDGGWTGMQCGSSAQLPIELRRRIKSVIMAGLQGKSHIPQAEYAHLQSSTHNSSNASMDIKDMANVVNDEKQYKQKHLQTRKDANVNDPAMELFVQNNTSPDHQNTCDKLKDINTTKTESNREANVNDDKHDDEFDIDAFLQTSSSSSSSSESSESEVESEQEERVLQ